MSPSEEYRKRLRDLLLYMKHSQKINENDIKSILDLTDEYIYKIYVRSVSRMLLMDEAYKKANELKI